MKVHIVFCHPSENSLTYELKESYIKGLKASDINFTVSDLYKKNFKSDILRRNISAKPIMMNPIFQRMFYKSKN